MSHHSSLSRGVARGVHFHHPWHRGPWAPWSFSVERSLKLSSNRCVPLTSRNWNRGPGRRVFGRSGDKNWTFKGCPVWWGASIGDPFEGAARKEKSPSPPPAPIPPHEFLISGWLAPQALLARFPRSPLWSRRRLVLRARDLGWIEGLRLPLAALHLTPDVGPASVPLSSPGRVLESSVSGKAPSKNRGQWRSVRSSFSASKALGLVIGDVCHSIECRG